MQPPPRKVKSTVALKNTQSEHIAKLQAKHQLEFDLLEDIRAFSKQRSTIEKDYAQALIKLSNQYLTKKEFPAPPDSEDEENPECKMLTSVWKTVLQETDTSAKSRLQASDIYLQKVSEPARIMKMNKYQLLEKVMESLRVFHAEISQTVREMAKAQKLYNDDEKEACDARQKAAEAGERLKKKNPGIFQSMATLQRNTAKLHSRQEACEAKSMLSRNEYLLTMYAASSHQARYFNTDLPELMSVLDGNVYNTCQELFKLLGETERQCCNTTIKSCDNILSDAVLVSREYNLNHFLKENPVFTNTVQYEFEPWDHDQITTISGDHNASGALSKEAKKWAAKIAKENKVLRDCSRNVKALQAQGGAKFDRQSSASSDSGKSEDPEQKLEDLKNQMRKAETAKLKAEARIEALRAAGVEVDEWLNCAYVESLLPDDDDISRTSSQMSIQTNSSGHSEDVDQPVESTYISYDNDFIDDTFDSSVNSPFYDGGVHYPCYCTVLYDFQGSNVDELDLVANEQLELIGSGEGDGWLRARNSEGKVGYVPENYIQMEQQDDTIVRNDVDARSSYSSTDYEVQAHVSVNDNQPPSDGGIWARALYDYQGISGEELSFVEGQVIKILRKDENGVDDGFWEGELNGKVGVFPCLVVEEIVPHQNGTGSAVDAGGDGIKNNNEWPPETESNDVIQQYEDTDTTEHAGIAAPQENGAEYYEHDDNESGAIITVGDQSEADPDHSIDVESDQSLHEPSFDMQEAGDQPEVSGQNVIEDSSGGHQQEAPPAGPVAHETEPGVQSMVLDDDGSAEIAGKVLAGEGGDGGSGFNGDGGTGEEGGEVVKPVPTARASRSLLVESPGGNLSQNETQDLHNCRDDEELEFYDESLETSCV